MLLPLVWRFWKAGTPTTVDESLHRFDTLMRFFALNAGGRPGEVGLHRVCFLLVTITMPIGHRIYQLSSPLYECVLYSVATVEQSTKTVILIGQLMPTIVLWSYIVLYTPGAPLTLSLSHSISLFSIDVRP